MPCETLGCLIQITSGPSASIDPAWRAGPPPIDLRTAPPPRPACGGLGLAGSHHRRSAASPAAPVPRAAAPARSVRSISRRRRRPPSELLIRASRGIAKSAREVAGA